MRDIESEMQEAEEKSLMYKRLIWIIGFAPAFAIAIAGKYLLNVIGPWYFLLIAGSMLVFLLVLAGLAFKYHRRYTKLKKQYFKEKKIKKEQQKFDDLYVKRENPWHGVNVVKITNKEDVKKLPGDKVTVKCRKCNHEFGVFDIPSTEPRPILLKCPYCGKEGVIK